MTTNNPFAIDGARVLITGGTAGIGRAVAQHFAEQGARVVITGRRDSGAAIAEAIGALYQPMDVSDAKSIQAGTAAAVETLGGAIDVLVLNAGITPALDMVDDIKADDMERTFSVNVYAVVHGLKAALPHLPEGASVIVTSSPAAQLCSPGSAIYSASKAAVDAFVRTWSLELADRGIRVNAILPGVVKTEMIGDPDNAEAELDMLSAFTATGAIRQPEEMAPAFQFLASRASTPCTGSLLAFEDGALAGVGTGLIGRAFGA